MELTQIFGHLFGPNGGIFGGGVLVGGLGFWKFLSPKLIAAKMEAMQGRIDTLEEQVADLRSEVAPFREWQSEHIKAALNAKKS